MKIGEAFNPWQRFQGILIPDGIVSANWLTAPDKIVFGRLLKFAGKNGECWPSHDRLARDCGVSRATVRRAIQGLLRAHLIEVRRSRLGGANSYEFLWHEIYSPFVLGAAGEQGGSLVSRGVLTSGHKENQ